MRENMCRRDKSANGRARKPRDFANWLNTRLLKEYLDKEAKQVPLTGDSDSDDDETGVHGAPQPRGKHRRQPGGPISKRTAQRYLHFLGFEYVVKTTGQYFDRHDDPDNVAARHQFAARLRTMELSDDSTM